MEWKVTRFCEFSSGNERAEPPLILTFFDGSQVWGHPSWLICIHPVRQQKSLVSPVITGRDAFRAGDRRCGSYPKTGVMSGLATIQIFGL